MGRTVNTLGTNKAVITSNVSTALSTVYTNTTGVGSEVIAVNINSSASPTTLNTTATADEWSYFGSEINPLSIQMASTSTGFGVPYPVQLSDNRVLLISLPHFQHRGSTLDFMGGNTLQSQIVEYQTNKYAAGPMNNHLLAVAPYTGTSYSLWSLPNSLSGGYGQASFRAVALSPTKVVAVLRINGFFRMIRFTITGNSVDHVVADLDLSSATYFNNATSYAFSLDTVPGNTNKVVIGGYAATNWSVQAINVPNSAPMSAASVLTSTGIPVSTYQFTLSKMVRTATSNISSYIVAGATSATAGQAVVMKFDDVNNTFVASGAPQSLSSASTQWSGMEAKCLSTGTNINAVLAVVSTGTGNLITFYRQTSDTVASNSSTTLTLQHTTTRSITESFSWGNERVVFTGDASLLVSYDSSGVSTNLLPATETTNTSRTLQQWFPFNSRPLYNLYDGGSVLVERASQWTSRINISSTTSPGESSVLGNYFPFGPDYGINYAWSEPANCWVVGQNGKIYMVSVDGVIQSEVSIYSLDPSMNFIYRVAQVSVTPSGRILYACEYGISVVSSTSYWPLQTWNSLVNQAYAFVTDPVLAATDIAKTRTQQSSYNINGFLTCSMTTFIEEPAISGGTRVERAYLLYIQTIATPVVAIASFNGTNWVQLGSTSISSTTANSWNVGFRPNFRLIQDTPCSSANVAGLWRVVGSQGTSSLLTSGTTGISLQYSQGSFGSFNTQSFPLDNTQSTQGYGMTYSQYASGSRAGISVACQYDEVLTTPRIFASVNGRLSTFRGYYLTSGTTANNRFVNAAVSKFGYAVAYCNTSTADQTASAYVFDTVSNVPRTVLTTTSGNGWITANATGKISWKLFGTGVNTVFTVSGIPDDIKFYLALDDGSGNTFYLNNGQTISIITTDTGLYRNESVYFVPPGYSLKVRADTPFSLTTMISIREKI
jgi:hypothetical protein